MTIWIITVLLLASTAGLGFRQGAIRVAFSFVGIVLGGLLASPLSGLIRPMFGSMGVHNPMLLAALPLFVIFCVVLAIFKIAGFAVQRKVEVFYKYNAGDLRQTLWERLNHRLGLCLGFANGIAYLVLLAFVIYAPTYWSTQLASDSDPWYLRTLNRLGSDLQSTGLAKVAYAVEGLPPSYYEMADTAGMLYHTPLLEARLSRYPGLLALGERQEFQDLGNDTAFSELWHRQAPILELLRYPKIQDIINTPDTYKAVTGTVIPDLADLHAFLETGKSPKYDSEIILGRWNFDVVGAIALARQARTNISSAEMIRLRKSLPVMFGKTTFVAMTDQAAVVKNYPKLRAVPGAAPAIDLLSLPGQWRKTGGKYQFTINNNGKPEDAAVEIQGDRMSIMSPTMGMAFVRAD